MRKAMDRRRFLQAAALMAGTAALPGCAKVGQSRVGQGALQAGEDATMFVQRLLLTPQSLAREYSEQDISPWFKPNGTQSPSDDDYQTAAKAGFPDFRLNISGLVEHPFDISLAELRAMPARTQITRHDCVEGWSCIGKWTGVTRLKRAAGPRRAIAARGPLHRVPLRRPRWTPAVSTPTIQPTTKAST